MLQRGWWSPPQSLGHTLCVCCGHRRPLPPPHSWRLLSRPPATASTLPARPTHPWPGCRGSVNLCSRNRAHHTLSETLLLWLPVPQAPRDAQRREAQGQGQSCTFAGAARGSGAWFYRTETLCCWELRGSAGPPSLPPAGMHPGRNGDRWPSTVLAPSHKVRRPPGSFL